MVRALVLLAAIGFTGHVFGAEAETPKKEEPKKEEPKKEEPKKEEPKKEEPKKEGPGTSPAAPQKGIVTIAKPDIQYNGKTGKLKIVLSGKVDLLPPGAKITIELEYNYFVVGSCAATVGTDGTFAKTTLAPEAALPPGDEYELIVKVLGDAQPPTLREKVMKIVDDEKTVIGTYQGKFSLGSAEDRKLWREKMAKAVSAMLEELVALNNDLAEKRTAADAEAKAGKFDAKKWREFIDVQWRPKIIALQKKFATWKTENASVGARFPKGVLCLSDMLAIVALRSKFLSQSVYGVAKQKYALEDMTPPPEMRIELEQATLKTDKKALQLLGEYYKVVEEDFGLKPPDEGKKDSPKKEPAKKDATRKDSGKSEPAKTDPAKKT